MESGRCEMTREKKRKEKRIWGTQLLMFLKGCCVEEQTGLYEGHNCPVGRNKGR